MSDNESVIIVCPAMDGPKPALEARKVGKRSLQTGRNYLIMRSPREETSDNVQITEITAPGKVLFK